MMVVASAVVVMVVVVASAVMVVVASEVVTVAADAASFGAKKFPRVRVDVSARSDCSTRGAFCFLLPQGWQLPMCRAQFAWCDADKSSSHFGHDRGASASFRRRSASSRHLFSPRCWGSCANDTTTTMPQQSGHKPAVLRLPTLIGSSSAGRSNGLTGRAPSASRSSFDARAIAARTSSLITLDYV